MRAPSGRPSDPFAHPAPAARSVPGDDGAAGGARSQRRRHEARPHMVGPRMVRRRHRHRCRDLRAHGSGGQGGRRPRHRHLLRRLRRLQHALRLAVCPSRWWRPAMGLRTAIGPPPPRSPPPAMRYVPARA